MVATAFPPVLNVPVQPLSLARPCARLFSVPCALEHASPFVMPWLVASPHSPFALIASPHANPEHWQVQPQALIVDSGPRSLGARAISVALGLRLAVSEKRGEKGKASRVR